jgi:hypothetical protein
MYVEIATHRHARGLAKVAIHDVIIRLEYFSSQNVFVKLF